VDGAAVGPRQLIGRPYRTGVLQTNITDSVQVQSLTFVSSFGLFLGVGICCTDAWCHPMCQPYDGHFVVISFDPTTSVFAVLADIGATNQPLPQAREAPTALLGIEYFDIFQPQVAYTLYDDYVLTYAIQQDDVTRAVTATLQGRSDKSIPALHAWTVGWFD